MALKEKSYEELKRDETQYEALARLVESANEIVGDKQFCIAGEGFKRERRYRGECMQRLIKEMYHEYGEECNKFPEIRFTIFPDSGCTLILTDGKKIDYYGD